MMRLCRVFFVCGEIIKETFFYTVHEHLDLLAAALNCPSLFSIPDVTPLNFCKKCHLALSMVKNGGTVKTGRTSLEALPGGGGFDSRIHERYF